MTGETPARYTGVGWPDPGDGESPDGGRSFRTPWVARVQPLEERLKPGCPRLPLGQLPAGRATVPLVRPSGREAALTTWTENARRKRAHAFCAGIGQWVAHYPTLRFQPGPKRFAGRSTTNFLLPAALWWDRYSEVTASTGIALQQL